LGGGILNILQDLNLGFAQFISIGNQADVNADSAIEYWEKYDETRTVVRFCTSWATKDEAVEQLIADVNGL
jgi:threonine aldolase